MLETIIPVVVMKHPIIIPEVTANYLITGKNHREFFFNNSEFQFLSSTPEAIKCSNIFCDKQRINDIAECSHGCGYYYILGNRYNIIIDHTISASRDY